MADPEYFTYEMTSTNHMYSSSDDTIRNNRFKEHGRPRSQPNPTIDEITLSMFQQKTNPPFMTNSQDYYYPGEQLKSN